MPHVIIVEDDQSIAEMLQFHMQEQGYQVTHFADGEKARQFLLQDHKDSNTSFDLVVLDIMLPGCNGLDICKQLRYEQPLTPILMLTSLSAEADRVIGLELGADDYLTKPFSMRECVARVKALLRRSQAVLSMQSEQAQEKEVEQLHVEELVLDAGSRTVLFDHKSVDLTAREFDLLFYLLKNKGRVFSRNQLLDAVWGYSHDGYEHTVNTHINRLRNKLVRTEGKADFIQTVWGVGYKFLDEESSTSKEPSAGKESSTGKEQSAGKMPSTSKKPSTDNTDSGKSS